MAILRTTAVWSGFAGAPGYTNFFFDAFGSGDSAELEVARTRAFFNALASDLPESVSIQVQQEAAIIDETTGELQSYVSVDAVPLPVIGGSGASFSAASGGVVTWNTDTVVRGRRLRGRTFVVPLDTTAYDAQGTLASSTITLMNDAAAALIGDGSGPQLVIWARPRTGADGAIGSVTSHRVADRVAVLRSRRD